MLSVFLAFWLAASALVLLQPPKRPAPRPPEPRTARGEIILRPGGAIAQWRTRNGSLAERDKLVEELAGLAESPWRDQQALLRAPSVIQRAVEALSPSYREAARRAVIATDYDKRSLTISLSVSAQGAEAVRAYCNSLLSTYGAVRPDIVGQHLVPAARALDAQCWALLAELDAAVRRYPQLRSSPEFAPLLDQYRAGRALLGIESDGPRLPQLQPAAKRSGRRARTEAMPPAQKAAYTIRERLIVLAELRDAVHEELAKLPDGHRVRVRQARLLPATQPDIHVIPKGRSLIWAAVAAGICAACAGLWRNSTASKAGACGG